MSSTVGNMTSAGGGGAHFSFCVFCVVMHLVCQSCVKPHEVTLHVHGCWSSAAPVSLLPGVPQWPTGSHMQLKPERLLQQPAYTTGWTVLHDGSLRELQQQAYAAGPTSCQSLKNWCV